MEELIELEEQGWQARSTEGDAARKFYNSVLRDDAIMVFPGGLLIDGKQNILESFSAQPWKSFHIEEMQVVSLSEDAAVLVYKVTAQREGKDPYVALMSSTYARSQGTWKLVVHQQTLV
jgi:hypothetical protein